MADQQQLDILKQGAFTWNNWRESNRSTGIDLAGADLRKTKLQNFNLFQANLMGADLTEVNLSESNLREAVLSKANLKNSILLSVDFKEAVFVETDLTGSVLWNSDLRDSHLWKANLTDADFSNVYLDQTNLWGAYFKDTVLGGTVFRRINLSNAHNLENARHLSASSVDIHTLQRSNGKIPEGFLRGCGLSDWEIESAKLYKPDLTNEEIVKIQYRMFELRATQALQISPLFISYSHADTPFVDHIDHALTEKGVRFWRDIHDAKAGRLETQIDNAIRQNPTVLLILSKNSLSSDWVEHEVRHARKLEKELGRDVICPIALDDAWKSSRWPERNMEQVMEYNILDFSGWEDQFAFEGKFAKLLSGLDLFYKKPVV